MFHQISLFLEIKLIDYESWMVIFVQYKLANKKIFFSSTDCELLLSNNVLEKIIEIWSNIKYEDYGVLR